jgi:peptidoglycan/xylan/chitin deacetylase (PgdA/CDA1 family)
MGAYPEFFPNEISRGNPFRKQVALTFDGGANRSYTPAIVDILARLEAKATFFVTGGFMKTYPAHTALMADRGYEIGNHSMTHPWLALANSWETAPEMTQERFYSELDEADGLFKSITGRSFDPLWRAPYGARSLELLRWGAERNLRHVYWTYDTLDWRTNVSDPLSKSGTSIIQDLMTYHEQAPHGLNGAIILLHLGAQRAEDPLYPHLTEFVTRLRQDGYSFVNVSDLLGEESRLYESGDVPPACACSASVAETFEPSGWSEGVWSDGWLAPRFSLRLTPVRGSTKLVVKLFVPDVVGKQSVSIMIDGNCVAQAELLPGSQHSLECVAPSRQFALDLFFSHFTCPAIMGTGEDRRYLAALLMGIS